jgi:hypothetical protein
MIVFNVTTIIEESIQAEYLTFMQQEHMPMVMATGAFISNNLFLLTEPQNEGITYCAQYITDSEQKLIDYRANHSPQLQVHFKEKFEGKYVAFRSVLHLVKPI